MAYWINIHHPRILNESRRAQCMVHVQERSRPMMKGITEGDLAFIYETGALSNTRAFVEDDSGKRTVQLLKGRKGIIALVRIGKFRQGKWKWNGIPFVGSYDTKELESRRNFVSLNDINRQRLSVGLPLFNPRIPGGLRELKKQEFTTIATLIGFEDEDDSRGWHRHEVLDTVRSYMSMLKHELNSQQYNKTAYRNRLLARLNDRSSSAAEYKHQNISAILTELGYPYIIGYQPHYGHYQRFLKDTVIMYISEDTELNLILTKAARRTPIKQPKVSKASDIIVDPPPRRPNRPLKGISTQRKPRLGVNYAARETANRKLGEQGERFAVNLEKKRLIEVGRTDLAEKVEWVSKEQGDSVGYDILSHDEFGGLLHIEVKTTNQGQYFPFIVSANEVAVSKELLASYRIYRIYNFSRQPKMFILEGKIGKNYKLRPLTYEASL